MVGGPLVEGTFQDGFNFMEALFLGSDAGVISIDEAKALWDKWLVIGVDVEEEGPVHCLVVGQSFGLTICSNRWGVFLRLG